MLNQFKKEINLTKEGPNKREINACLPLEIQLQEEINYVIS